MTTPSAADAVDAQQARQNRLDELYHQDGRHEPSHPMHGLYTGLVMTASTTTSPQNAMTDEFVFFTQNNRRGEKVAIRKSSINAFYCAYSGETILEYRGDSAVVVESFDEVCAALGIAPQQESKP
jgi:hypothetical protein